MVEDKKLRARARRGHTESVEGIRDEVEASEEELKAQGGLKHARRFAHWSRGPARIAKAEVVLDEERATPYSMPPPKDVVFDLAELAEVPSMIPTFVRRYGLLWHGAADLGSGECRESLADWFEEIRVFSSTVSLYYRLQEAVRSESSEPLCRGEFPWPDDFVREACDADYMNAASQEVADSINAGLKGCEVGMISTIVLDVPERGPAAFRITHNSPNLLVAAYERLALLITSRTEVEECPGCGKLFAPESGKQKYHSKSCASTSRWRRWRERQIE